jgi:hypothetical protein
MVTRTLDNTMNYDHRPTCQWRSLRAYADTYRRMKPRALYAAALHYRSMKICNQED